jgi:hypothetical protein
MRRKTTVMTVETLEYWSALPRTAWCPNCGRDVALLTLAEAAQRTGVSQHDVLRWILKQRVHATDTGEGPGICAESLEKSFSSGN